MIEVQQTPQFAEWFAGLTDANAKARIRTRILRVENGNFGDVKYFDGIGELRIHYGPGYRVYFLKRGTEIVILLGGGDKSTQQKDIERAIALAKEG